ncbi:Methyltransferase domain-containing protein [Desulfonatronum thiosulfatophilum]|uniref:Methyltransferase domain-containing protein n=1 Tax=Desulfonatronum thiosulfatophilum TaxID=617002 RepID=A0A1G6C0Q4_9BACT|nr:methyltransferase domain-containing protein [Desulfonatronum thiosulfatophilum]SDB26408.1 Methyltransferase domain-containing protein [Desulfonatronum thiosulfatophilum]
MDTVLLLDVLEHLPQPEQALAEASRVLRPGGNCLIHVPFLYPLHDEPHDYQRWTGHGLERMLTRHGFQVTETTPSTNPAETGASLFCIALAKGLLDVLRRKSPILLLAPLILACIPAINIGGWLLGKLLPSSTIMPSGYLCLGRKISEQDETRIHG